MSETTKDDSSPDDLTTDAIPSPPRHQEQVDDENQPEENVTRKQHHQQHNNHKIPKSTGFTKIKKNTPTGAFASVIISNSIGVHVGTIVNVTVNKSNPEADEENKKHVITPGIKALLTSEKPVTTENIALISRHMRSEEWKNTARILNYSDGQISQFYENHSRSGIEEVIYQFLLDWIQNEADGATVGKLSSALWETRQQEVVTMWYNKFSQ